MENDDQTAPEPNGNADVKEDEAQINKETLLVADGKDGKQTFVSLTVDASSTRITFQNEPV